MRNKRVFTKWLKGAGMSLPLAGLPVEKAEFPANQFWLLQEPIDIIGVELVGGVSGDMAKMNSGSGEFSMDVSQVGVLGADGMLAIIRGIWTSEGAAHLGGVWGTTVVVVMFPSDAAVPVREEGYVYLNGYINAYNGQLGQEISCQAYAIIYYTKRGA